MECIMLYYLCVIIKVIIGMCIKIMNSVANFKNCY